MVRTTEKRIVKGKEKERFNRRTQRTQRRNYEETKILSKTGQNIRILRKGSGLTQEKLAERIDIADRSLGRVERGEDQPSIKMVLKLAKGMGVEGAEILRGVAL
jgi:DNA-binding XRE family transcriptional regulator